ncbi:MAG: FAD-binding protein [Peptococcaceae bacterium]
MDNDQVATVETDVVVIGSGSAGSMAALTARKAGVRVALVDKGGIYRSGCGAAGEDHFVAVLEKGEEWDTPEVFLKWYHTLSQGLCNPRVVENSFLRHIKGLVEYLENLGIKMRLDEEKDDYIRTASYSAPGKYWINFDGIDLPTKIAAESQKAGVDFFPKTAVTDLIVKDGRIAGVAGLDFRNNILYIFKCKAAILCTSGVCRLYDNHSGLPYNTWNSPYNTGLAQRAAFEAGAELANMEFIGFNITPKNFGSPGLAGLTGMGAHLVNGQGERIVFKYHPLGEGGPRWALCKAVYTEINEGRGPIYIDARHLPAKDLEHLLKHLLTVDKKTMQDYLDQKKLDLSKDLFEIEVTGGEIPPMSGHVSGILVDENMAATLTGLYAAGGSALSLITLSGAMCTGMTAAESAARLAQTISHYAEIDASVLDQIKERVFRPLENKKGLRAQEVEDKIRQINSRYVCIGRTAKGLQTALDDLAVLENYIPQIQADNGHQLMRCLEVQELLQVSKMIARGALIREESRFGFSHYRTDFPETKVEWQKMVIQKKAREDVEITFKPAYQLEN